MTSIRLFEVKDCSKYLLHNRSILHCGSRILLMRACPSVGLNIAFLSTVICGNRTKFCSQHPLLRTAGLVSPVLTGYNWKLCKHQHINVPSPDPLLFTYCSTISDSDLEQRVGDVHIDESVEKDDKNNLREKENFMQKYCHSSNLGDDNSVHRELESEWEEELKDIKEMLKCSEEEFVKLVTHYPRLKNMELLKQVKGNVRILLGKGIKKRKVVSKLLSSQGVFLQICPSELSEFFQELDRKGKKLEKHGLKNYQGWYTDLRLYLTNHLKGGMDEEKFLVALLNVKYEMIVKLHRVQDLDVIKYKVAAYLLKEKVDYLLYEGLLPEDIAYNMELLLMPLKYLGTSIAEMKTAIEEISIPTLKSSYYKRMGLRDLPSRSKIPLVFGCSLEDFSELQRVFLNHANQTDAINVAFYLLDKGIDKQEIISNPYVLGHKLEKVRDCIEKNLKSCDASKPEEQKRLLNLTVYDLEYKGDAV